MAPVRYAAERPADINEQVIENFVDATECQQTNLRPYFCLKFNTGKRNGIFFSSIFSIPAPRKENEN